MATDPKSSFGSSGTEPEATSDVVSEEVESISEAPPEDMPASDPQQDLARLRELLVGRERRDIDALRGEFDSWNLTPEEVAEHLPDAIALRSTQDHQLGRALAPTLEEGITESVHRNPQQIAQAIYPILGPAIRKAISETISGFVETLNKAIEHSFSIRGLKWRIEAWRTGVPYGEIVLKHALVYQVEQAFLIHAESGLMLAHVALDEKKSRDPDLVSGMLTAIKDFVGDSFEASQEDGLRTFSVGGLTVMVETGPRALLATVIRGQAPASLFERVNAASESIHLQLRTELKSFEGDTEPFEAATPTLEELLETVVATDRPQSRSKAPIVAWAVAGVAALVLIGLGVRSSMRWNAAKEVLRAEPGITLFDADRSWGSWVFSGLLDPLARSPEDVLEEAGFTGKTLRGHWEPYMSFDTEIVQARSASLLEPPPSATLRVDGSVLRLSGRASARWALQAQERALGLAGVSTMDMTGLDVTVPDDLAGLVDRMTAHRVLFNIGSSELTAEALAQLDAMAPEFEHLNSLAHELGYAIRIDIVGRTDTSGTEETNRALSQQRSQAVLQALMDRGVTPDEVTATGLGVSDPLPAEDEETQARMNRSTSFVVTLEGWGAS